MKRQSDNRRNGIFRPLFAKKKQKVRVTQKNLRLEALEPRQMLSATPWLPSTSDVVDRVSDEAIRTQPEAAYVAPSESGMRDAVVDSVMIINPDSMRPADGQRIGISPVPTPVPGGGSVMVVNPDSMRPVFGRSDSNPTPHPMPVPELSDSVSMRHLEHGPGLHDTQRVGLSVGPIGTSRYSLDTGPIGTSRYSLNVGPIAHGPAMRNAVVDSVMVINPDSMRPADGQWISISPVPTPIPMPVPELSDDDTGSYAQRAGVVFGRYEAIWTDGTMVNVR